MTPTAAAHLLPREGACLHADTPPIAGVSRTLVIGIADG